MPENKCSMDNMLQAILSVGNSERNATYPPEIYDAQYNTATSLLISNLVKIYPDSPSSLDILDPFVKFALLPVQNGVFNLPGDYRNILGSPYIFSNTNSNGECQEILEIKSAQQFSINNMKGSCSTIPLIIVPESEFSYRTKSSYNFPTYKNPIGYMSGNKTVKICPFDVTKVALLYVRKEVNYKFGYQMQPDDTYIFDPETTIESEWDTAAFEPLYKAMTALYSAYTRDPSMNNWSQILIKEGVF